MAAKEFNDWVKGDVAIEIIGKMIAEEMAVIHRLSAEYNENGVSVDDSAIQEDTEYKASKAKIRQYQQEIQAVYKDADSSLVIQKATAIYAPYLFEKRKMVVAD